MKKYIVAGILFAATMLVSCGGLQSFTFDQLYPAEVTFPEPVSYTHLTLPTIA